MEPLVLHYWFQVRVKGPSCGGEILKCFSNWPEATGGESEDASRPMRRRLEEDDDEDWF